MHVHGRRGRGPAARRRPARPAAIAAAGLLLAAGPASADGLYDTGRVARQDGNACSDRAPGACATLAAKPRRVPAGGSSRVALRCPSDRPYLRGWDARHDEHVGLRVVAPGITGKGLTLAAVNKGDAPGSFTVFLGCAARPAAGTSMMETVDALPSRSPLLGGGR